MIDSLVTKADWASAKLRLRPPTKRSKAQCSLCGAWKSAPSGRDGPKADTRACTSECPLSTQSGHSAAAAAAAPVSHFSSLGELESIFDVNAEIPHSAFDLGVAEQDLHRTQVAGLLVDYGGFCPPQ